MRAKHLPQQNTSPVAKEHIPAFLAQCALFQGLDATALSTLERSITTLTCSSGRILYRPGETGRTLFLLASGLVELYHLSTDGRKLIIATHQGGACFGETALLGHLPYSSFAETTMPSQLILIQQHDLEQFLAQYPQVALALLSLSAQRIVQVETQLVDAAFKSAPARLARLLLQLAHPQQRARSTILVVDGLSHEELAEHLGVYRETVSSALRDLKDAGAITPGRKHIIISQPSLLETIANA